jgi:hypothetical protein
VHGRRIILATLALALGIAGAFAFASYNPVHHEPGACSTFLGQRQCTPSEHWHAGTPTWAVAAAWASPIVGGIVFGVVVLLALVPLVRRLWRTRRPVGLGSRVFGATMVLGLGIAGAVLFVNWQTHGASYCGASTGDFDGNCTQWIDATARPDWALPVAVLIGFLGLAAGTALLIGVGRRR